MDFDKCDVWVHNFTMKMLNAGIKQDELRSMWDEARTVKYFSYSCRKRLAESTNNCTDVTYTGSAPNRVSFAARPVKNAHVDIPISHYFTHRPKLAGCLFCELGKCELTPIVRTKPDIGEQGIEGSKLEVDADFVGKKFPLGSNGATHALCMQSHEGHFWCVPCKGKSEPELDEKGKRAFSRAGIALKSLDFNADEELKTLGKDIELAQGSYNSGIANRSNSHARAENCVKNVLGGLKSSSLASACPAKDWPDCAEVLSYNVSRETGNKYLHQYKGPLFAHGETADLKLEPSVYTPPVMKPAATKVMFCNYVPNSDYGIKVEFYDEHQEKRRRTEVTSTAFEKGLPAKRPVFGYRRIQDEGEPLSTHIQGMLSDKEQPIELPRRRQLAAYQRENARAKAKAKVEPKGKAKAKARGVQNKSISDVEDFEEEWYSGFAETTEYENWIKNYDFASQELYFDLGQTDQQDFDDGRTPMEVSLGEQARVTTQPRPGRDLVKLTKVLKPREITQDPYNKLDWKKAYKKEQVKMFEKFCALGEAREMDSLPEGAQCIRNFGVHTVKNFDSPEEWDAGYRLVGAGNNVFQLKEGKWVKIGTVIDRQKDAIESATMETTRLFIHCNKIRRRKQRKKDADGAYLQAPPSDTSKRPKGLWAEIPPCMIPDGSPALQMRRPVFSVDQSMYGMDDAGFSWDKYSTSQLVDAGFFPYYDLSQSLFDHFPEGTDTSILDQEEEIMPNLYPVDDGQLSKYVDDFLSAEDEGSGVHDKMTKAILTKEDPSDELEIGRYVGSTWEGVNDPPDAEGIYRYASQQIQYVKTFVENSEGLVLQHTGKPLKEADTPALANDSAPSAELDETTGLFAPDAASIVCALLYVARLSRVDTLFAVCRMTRYLTKWMRRQDQWLVRCLGYLKKTMMMKLNFQIYPPDFDEGGDGEFENWADADLGGDKTAKRSTSGGCGFLKGSKSRALVHAHCKRQGQTGISTPETETVAMVVLGKKVIPLHMIAQRLLKRFLKLSYKGDNSACERVIGTGMSQALSYMKRTAGLSLRWANENMSEFVERTPTDENIGDIFTKALETSKFEKFRKLLGIW